MLCKLPSVFYYFLNFILLLGLILEQWLTEIKRQIKAESGDPYEQNVMVRHVLF